METAKNKLKSLANIKFPILATWFPLNKKQFQALSNSQWSNESKSYSIFVPIFMKDIYTVMNPLKNPNETPNLLKSEKQIIPDSLTKGKV